jgi:hypothetical protein
VHIESNNANPGYAKVGDVVNVTFDAGEPLDNIVVTMSDQPASVSLLEGTLYQAVRTFDGSENEGGLQAWPLIINYTDMAGNPGEVVTNTTDDSNVVFLKTPPVINSVFFNQTEGTLKIGDELQLTIVPDYGGRTPGTVLINDVPALSVFPDGDNISAVYVVSENDTDRSGGDIPVNVTIYDAAGNPGTYESTSDPSPAIDAHRPTLTDVRVYSTNALNASVATDGDTIIVNFTANEPLDELLNSPMVYFNGVPEMAALEEGTTYVATHTVSMTDGNALVMLGISFYDAAGNQGLPIHPDPLSTTDSSSVVVDLVSPTVTSATIDDPDRFYSPAPGNDVIHLNVTAEDGPGGTGVVAVRADLSSIGDTGATCGVNGSSILDLVQNGDGYWAGACNVSDVAAAVSDFVGGSINVVAIDGAGRVSDMPTMISSVVLYNLSRPVSPDPCFRFGEQTTDFATEPDFANINLIIEMQVNGSPLCTHLPQPLPWGSEFHTVLLMNFSAIDMSDQNTAAKLRYLPMAINVTIAPPRSFRDSRIFIDKDLISELSRETTITFYDLPFTSLPYVEADDPAEQSTLAVTDWSSAYSDEWNMTTGNLTFTVTGFSGYNVTDSDVPTITINEPSSGLYTAVNTPPVNVTLDGTGTQIQRAYFYLETTNNETNRYVYDGSNNSANCEEDAPGSEVYNCLFTLPELTDGAHELIVVAYDFGSGGGNGWSETSTFTVDTSAPVVNITRPGAEHRTNGNIEFTIDDLSPLDTCWFVLGNGTEDVIPLCSSPLALDIPDESTGNITIYANDTLGNTGSASADYTIDLVGPAVTLISPEDGSTLNFSTTPDHYFNVTDATDATVTCTLTRVEEWEGGEEEWIVFGDVPTNESAIDAGYWYGTVNGSYSWNIVCADAAGNEYTTTSWHYTMDDTTAPVISNPLPSGSKASSTTSVKLEVTTDESAACKYDTSDVAYDSMANDFTDNFTEHIATYTVSSGHSYKLYVRCSDYALGYVPSNVNNASTTIAFSVASSGGRSGGGGGGGAPPVFTIGSTGAQRILATTTSLNFQLPGSTVTHTVTVKNITADGVWFELRSTPVPVFLKAGESKSVDITGDGVPDVMVTLKSFTATAATFLVGTPSSAPPATPPTAPPAAPPVTPPAPQPPAAKPPAAQPPAAQTGQTAPAATEGKSTAWLWWVVIAIVVVVFVLMLSWRKKKPFADYSLPESSVERPEHPEHHAPHHTPPHHPTHHKYED